MNINPFLDLIISILKLYKLSVTVWAILSLLIYFNIINRHQPMVQKLFYILNRLAEPALSKIRNYVPNIGGLDLSPVILFLLINFVERLIIVYFYR